MLTVRFDIIYVNFTLLFVILSSRCDHYMSHRYVEVIQGIHYSDNDMKYCTSNLWQYLNEIIAAYALFSAET